MIELNEEARAQWKEYIGFYSKALKDPEHIKIVQNFVESYEKHGLSSSQTVDALQNMIKSISQIFNVKISNIVIAHNSTINGSYNPQNRGLFFNASIGNVADFLMTIYHEMRHAWQFQFLQYQNNEFGKAMRYEAQHYTCYDKTLLAQADYFTNLLEEDAVMFSVSATDNVLTNLPVVKELRDKYIKQLDKLQIYRMDKIHNFKNVKKSIISNTKSYIKDYSEVLLQIFKYQGSLEEKTKKIDKDLAELNRKYASMQETIKKDKTFYNEVLRYIFDNCSIIEIASNINDPHIALLKSMENKNGVKGFDYARSIFVGMYTGSRFEQIKEIVSTAKGYLEHNNIPFDKADNGRMLTTFLDSSHELYAQAFERVASGKNEDDTKDKSLITFLNTLSFHGIVDKDKINQHIIEKYGMRKIRSWFVRASNEKNKKTGQPILNENTVKIAGFYLIHFEKASKNMKSTEMPRRRSFWRNALRNGGMKNSENEVAAEVATKLPE